MQRCNTRKDGDAAWKMIAEELVAAPIQFHPADRPLDDTAADFKARFRISLATPSLQHWPRRKRRN
jgi:hypothetical protein